MDREFADKVVLVTGATSGIGRACALRFAGAGARIAAAGRNEEALTNLSREIERAGGKTLLLRADLSLVADAQRIVEQTMKHFGGIDFQSMGDGPRPAPDKPGRRAGLPGLLAARRCIKQLALETRIWIYSAAHLRIAVDKRAGVLLWSGSGANEYSIGR